MRMTDTSVIEALQVDCTSCNAKEGWDCNRRGVPGIWPCVGRRKRGQNRIAEREAMREALALAVLGLPLPVALPLEP